MLFCTLGFFNIKILSIMEIALKNQLIKAVKLANAGDWDASHRIVQYYNDATAFWIHALLHKIEGDESNSRYWYARCNARFKTMLTLVKSLMLLKIV
jgi:hypothetical protein